MNKRAAHKFSAEQDAYLVARALHETLEAAYQDGIKGEGFVCLPGMTEEQKDAVSDRQTELYCALGIGAAFLARDAAEVAMVKWSIGKTMAYARKHAPHHVATVAGVFDLARRSPSGWPKLVDSSAKLAA